MSNAIVMVSVIVVTLLSGGSGWGWELSYNGDVLPTAVSLGPDSWTRYGDPSETFAMDGVLRTAVAESTYGIAYYRDLPSDGPLTAEVRLRVLAASADVSYENGPGLAIHFGGRRTVIRFAQDKLFTRYLGDLQDRSYDADMTQWHTMRVAITLDEWFRVYLDGNEVFSGAANSGGQNGITFGTGFLVPAGSDVIEWDYVAYSGVYIPVAEPTSIFALAAGFATLVGTRRNQSMSHRRPNGRRPSS